MSATDLPESPSDRSEVDELRRRLALAEAELAASRGRESALGRSLTESEAELGNQHAAVAELRATVDEVRATGADLQAEQELLRDRAENAEQAARARAELEPRLRELERALDAITGSLSWRATRPLRRLKAPGGQDPGA